MFQKLLSSLVSFIKLIYLFLITLPRDIKGLILMTYVERKFKKFEENRLTTARVFEKLVKKQPNKPCILFDDSTWTFQEVEDYANKIANSFSKKYQLRKGDTVAIFMENRPEYICIWLGLSKIGVISALINTNLKSQALVHSINISNPKVLVYSNELVEPINQVRTELVPGLNYVSFGSGLNTIEDTKLETLILNASLQTYVPEDILLPSDTLMYIYTSGTTGLPKPAVIKHSRYYGGGITFFESAGLNKNDIIYNALPIYHANGGMIGVGCALASGATVVLRKKFSASNFWKECIQYKCTAMMYVGELCRYLVNQPPSPYDKQHKVRVAMGNGLRANVWSEFTSRFGVEPREFYAASEGNCTIINVNGKVGACGFMPVLNHIIKALPVSIIKIDENMNPIRDENGFCIPCKPYEKGLFVGIIGNTVKTSYSGYANNKKASNTKIITDLFKKDQKSFNSGDLMMRDEFGWIYFCDRLGDTYRWRGENVATIEVENIISKAINYAEVVVYGVEIPDQEGRAGMAAIISATDVDMTHLTKHIKDNLTTYARPLFIRILDNVEHTGSFKAKKTKLVEEGYNLNLIQDKMYYFNPKEQQYSTLTKSIYEDICKAKLKL